MDSRSLKCFGAVLLLIHTTVLAQENADNPLETNLIIQEQELQQEHHFQAEETMLLDEVQVAEGAHVEFVAGQLIEVKGEVFFSTGSEVHLWAGETEASADDSVELAYLVVNTAQVHGARFEIAGPGLSTEEHLEGVSGQEDSELAVPVQLPEPGGFQQIELHIAGAQYNDALSLSIVYDHAGGVTEVWANQHGEQVKLPGSFYATENQKITFLNPNVQVERPRLVIENVEGQVYTGKGSFHVILPEVLQDYEAQELSIFAEDETLVYSNTSLSWDGKKDDGASVDPGWYAFRIRLKGTGEEKMFNGKFRVL